MTVRNSWNKGGKPSHFKSEESSIILHLLKIFQNFVLEKSLNEWYYQYSFTLLFKKYSDSTEQIK